MEQSNQTPQREPGRSHQNNSAKRKHSAKRRGGSTLAFALKSIILTCFCTGVIFVGIFAVYIYTCIIPNAHVDVSDLSMSQSSVIYYENSNGDWEELETLHGGVNRIWSDYETLPPALTKAAIAIEDKRFLDHDGVDWLRTGKAVVNLFVGFDSSFGGSTLTQQTIKNVTGEREGTVKRKINEIFRALDFEKSHSKEEIMELYLNNIYLGHGCTGVTTAAKEYFGKDVSDLTIAECATLIGITNNPSLYNPYGSDAARERTLKRKNTILYEMWNQGWITEEEYNEAKDQELIFDDGSDDDDNSEAYSWFVDQLINDLIKDLQEEKGYTEAVATQMIYYGGLKIYCTQNLDVQKCVDEVYENRDNLPYTSQGYKMQSAITIIDPYTGNIVAMAGDMGEKTGSRLYNNAAARRQCGSAIKPISAYAPALDAGVITPASAIDDSPVRILNDRIWPKNSHSYYDGLVTVDYAIAHSLNPCAVRTVEAVGIEEAYTFMEENLGFTTLVSAEDNPNRNDMNSASLGLGGLTRGVSTIEMAAAYGAFVNEGIYIEPRTYTRVTDQDDKVILDNESNSWQAMKKSTAYFMNKYLRQVITSGTGGSANFSGMTVAGKTGTTTDNYDRYFVGYTPYYVAAVWTGYEVNIKVNATGNPSAQLFKKVMSKVHANLPNKNFFELDEPLVEVTTCMDCGLLATELCAQDVRGSRVQTVKVAEGTAPEETCTCHVEVEWCSAGDTIAGTFCPEEQIVMKSVVNYTRPAELTAGLDIRDAQYHFDAFQTAEKVCQIHTEPVVDPVQPVDPDDPDEPIEPNDPADVPGRGDEDESASEDMDSANNLFGLR